MSVTPVKFVPEKRRHMVAAPKAIPIQLDKQSHSSASRYEPPVNPMPRFYFKPSAQAMTWQMKRDSIVPVNRCARGEARQPGLFAQGWH